MSESFKLLMDFKVRQAGERCCLEMILNHATTLVMFDTTSWYDTKSSYPCILLFLSHIPFDLG